MGRGHPGTRLEGGGSLDSEVGEEGREKWRGGDEAYSVESDTVDNEREGKKVISASQHFQTTRASWFSVSSKQQPMQPMMRR